MSLFVICYSQMCFLVKNKVKVHFSLRFKYGDRSPLVWEEQVTLIFLSTKSATTCQICANSVPNSKFKSLLFKNLKDGKVGFIAPSQQPFKRST